MWSMFKYIQEDLADDILSFFGQLICNCDGMTCHRSEQVHMNNSKGASCPHCTNNDSSLIEKVIEYTRTIVYICNVCSKTWVIVKENGEKK